MNRSRFRSVVGQSSKMLPVLYFFVLLPISDVFAESDANINGGFVGEGFKNIDVISPFQFAEDVLPSEQVKRDGSEINPAIVSQILARGPPNAGAFSPYPGKCVCVPYYLCEAKDIISGKSGLIDPRIIVRTRNETSAGPYETISSFLDSLVGHKRHVNPASVEDPLLVAPMSRNSLDDEVLSVGGNCPGVSEVCCRKPLPLYETEFAFKSEEESNRRECGVHNQKGVGAEFKFDSPGHAQYAEFPWMAVIVQKGANGRDSYLCGGTLVHEDAVMTAAHCVHSKHPALLSVVLGEWDTQSHYELFPEQKHYVSSIVIHEDYNPSTLSNDIALVFLSTNVQVNPAVSPACIPNFGDVAEGPCWVAGWGKAGFGNPDRYQNILTKVEVPVMDRLHCEAMLKQTRLGPYYRLDDSMLCTGGELDKDACHADGGGPLMCPIPGYPGRLVIAGVASWSIGCGNGLPGVYTSIARLGPWIDFMLSQKLQEQMAVNI